MLTISLCPIPHSSFVFSLSGPFLEFLFYRYSHTGTCRREIVFKMNCWSLWLDCSWAHHTLLPLHNLLPLLLYTFPETFSSSVISVLASRSSGYPLPSPLESTPMFLILNIVPLLHLWSLVYLYLCDVRLLTLHWKLVSWGRFLLREYVQRGELLLITIWDDLSKGYYEG